MYFCVLVKMGNFEYFARKITFLKTSKIIKFQLLTLTLIYILIELYSSFVYFNTITFIFNLFS